MEDLAKAEMIRPVWRSMLFFESQDDDGGTSRDDDWIISSRGSSACAFENEGIAVDGGGWFPMAAHRDAAYRTRMKILVSDTIILVEYTMSL